LETAEMAILMSKRCTASRGANRKVDKPVSSHYTSAAQFDQYLGVWEDVLESVRNDVGKLSLPDPTHPAHNANRRCCIIGFAQRLHKLVDLLLTAYKVKCLRAEVVQGWG
jgi:hypothetical protein